MNLEFHHVIMASNTAASRPTTVISPRPSQVWPCWGRKFHKTHQVTVVATFMATRGRCPQSFTMRITMSSLPSSSPAALSSPGLSSDSRVHHLLLVSLYLEPPPRILAHTFHTPFGYVSNFDLWVSPSNVGPDVPVHFTRQHFTPCWVVSGGFFGSSLACWDLLRASLPPPHIGVGTCWWFQLLVYAA